jgi:K+-transporting ATPase ATPase B chain
MSTKSISLFDRDIMRRPSSTRSRSSTRASSSRTPVMFVTLIGAVLTFQQLFTSKEPFGYVLQVALWLLFTVVFANFAEAVAEGAARRRPAPCAPRASSWSPAAPPQGRHEESVDASQLRKDDLVVVVAGRAHPGRRRGRRGRRVGRRVRHHRRVRARHPRGGGDRSAVTGGTASCPTSWSSASRRTPARGSSTT